MAVVGAAPVALCDVEGGGGRVGAVVADTDPDTMMAWPAHPVSAPDFALHAPTFAGRTTWSVYGTIR